MGYKYDYRVSLLGMSALCCACGVALALQMMTTAFPAPAQAADGGNRNLEALRILADTYGVRVVDLQP